jgi:stage V sporulation protein AD
MTKKVGNQTFRIEKPVSILSTGTAAGPLEGQGPLSSYYDFVATDLTLEQKSFEKAERLLLQNACYFALQKAQLGPKDIDIYIGGDLLNQITTSGFTALEMNIPFMGQYGACSTAAQSLAIGSMLLDGGFGSYILAAASSHNSTSERQFRYPTEYGVHRKPHTQWTVTGGGAAILTNKKPQNPKITHVTIGKVTDLGCKDPLNLGAAMAPAAASSLAQHLADTGRASTYYDLIVTGDLGLLGKKLAIEYAATSYGIELGKNYNDCGVMVYDVEKQDVHSGGSGCASSAITVFSYIYSMLKNKDINKLLFAGTGAMHSTTSCQQGDNIPTIAHCVAIENI